MRSSTKAWQVQRSMESLNGTEFENKLLMIDDHQRIQQEMIIGGEGRLLAKSLGR